MNPSPEGLILLLTYLAVSANAISGALEARKQEMDIVGATTVAFVTAFGGGSLRDLLLGRTPIFWLTDPWLSVFTFTVAVLAFYLLENHPTRLLISADALGLGFFSVLGATYALQMELSLLVAALMGAITGTFGGVLRDVLCNRVPNIFRKDTELYATCAFAGAWVYIILTQAGAEASLASWAGTFTAFALRLLAVRFKLTLPTP